MKGKPRKKTGRQLGAEIDTAIAIRRLLRADWPEVARRHVLESARWYHHESHEPWAVSDVLLDQAIEYTREALEREDRAGQLEDAKPSWYRRYESSEFDAEIRKAILAWSSAVARGSPRM